MVELKMSGIDFGRIVRACARAASRNDIREELRYIELRADGETCVATAIDGFVMMQLRVPCKGSGVVLLPCTVKPEKSETAVIALGDKLRISFYDEAEKLIIAYEYPKCDKEYFKWGEKLHMNERAESVIHFDARYMRRIAMATAHAGDQIFSIGIPENKRENIRIASKDAQAIIMPLNIMDEEHARKFENWYGEIK